jgi:hypothetical protein
VEFTRTPPTKFGLFIPRIPTKTTTVVEVLEKLKTSFPEIEVKKLILMKAKTKKDANGKEIKKALSALIYLSNAKDQDTILQKRWCAAILSFEKPDIKPESPSKTVDLTKNAFKALTNLGDSEMPPPSSKHSRSSSVGQKRKEVPSTPELSPQKRKNSVPMELSTFPATSFDFTVPGVL